MKGRKLTLDIALEEGWFKPNEKDGACYCGCGEQAPVASQGSRARGWVAGESLRYITGHNSEEITGRSPRRVPDVSGEKNPQWKGGTYTIRGYVQIWVSVKHPYASMRNKAGYVPQHRLVMAEHIGRPLGKDEVVHHLNHIKDDNRIENLELMSRADHTKHHVDETVLAVKLIRKLRESGTDVEKWLTEFDPESILVS